MNSSEIDGLLKNRMQRLIDKEAMEEFKFDLKLESYDKKIKIKSKFDIHKNDKPVIEINDKL